MAHLTIRLGGLSKMATPYFIAKIQKPSFWGKFHLILTNFLNFRIIQY